MEEDKIVQLGFLEQAEDPARLSDFEYLPDKVGGKPIYAPFKEFDHTYHRVVYIFSCKNGSCHASLAHGSFKVFRCQLPKDNPYYESKSEDAIEEDPEAAQYIYHMPEKVFFCAECGMRAEKRCSACKMVHYCTVTHQKEHWGRGHKEECEQIKAAGQAGKKAAPAVKPSLALFDEWEIITEEEPSDDEKEEGEDYEKKLSRKYKELKMLHKMKAQSRPKLGPGELPVDFPVPEEPDEEAPIDDSFIEFQHRVKRAPDQVLRYSRWDGAKPLWVRDSLQPTADDVPPCPHCQTPRKFEFQVLPQLLHYLEVEKVEKEGIDKAINWGTVAVFSCPKSCQPTPTDEPNSSGPTYFEECTWRQNME
ncbi:MYND finger domain containing protein [Acanthamoeba castellanii str. Neff]|uniref:MYND finger domain containing protein n=1 Tax=Acanthamoeba castellanii (strain ATCC 30010 / Neff) TaxID=1257118 RepID=L8H6J3_ACACF|nr:MYND finger domain containing protein [Acanthamoeba castellanii str. Neff]ELR20373.1 MYND finger domain containing protein [Acanthamoeba castellanii str. Neff]